jgi:hypothetical protein
VTLASGQEIEAEVGVAALRRIGFTRDRDAILWRSALLPARRLARLAAGGVEPSHGVVGPRPPYAGSDSAAGSATAIPPFVGLAATVVRKVLSRILFRSTWFVLVRRRDSDQGPPSDLAGFEPVEAPAGRFYADPFVVATPEGPRIYVEDCPEGAHRGRISVLREDEDGRWVLERVALDDPGHRAYPHVVLTVAGLLATPDGGRRGGVDAYIDQGKDPGLRHIGVWLPDVPASDPTLLWRDGRYWLFVAVTGHGMNPWDELHLFSAADLADVWEPHPQNPVVADVRSARPAGRIFVHGDSLVRPGQDCSVEYGQRIVLSAITTLTTDAYEEKIIGSIEPAGVVGVQRTHTYTFDGSIEALDGYRRDLRRLRSPRAGR